MAKNGRMTYFDYADRHLGEARMISRLGKCINLVLIYQYSIEYFLKSALELSGCKDIELMRSHNILRLANAIMPTISKEQRALLIAVGKSYFELRYPLPDDRTDMDPYLEDFMNSDDFIDKLDSLAVECRQLALEAKYSKEQKAKKDISRMNLGN